MEDCRAEPPFAMACTVPIDQIDLGLMLAFFGDHRLCACHVALSGDAKHLAIAPTRCESSTKLLLFPQQRAAVQGPQQLALPTDADVCSLCWLEMAHNEQVLLAGCSCGQLCAFTSSGVPLWVVQPEVGVGLEASPLLQLQPLPGLSDSEPDLLCLFQGGSVACTRTREVHRWRVYDLPSEADGCCSIVCCGQLPPLPTDLLPAHGSMNHVGRGSAGGNIALVAARKTSLQLLTIEPQPRPVTASTASVTDASTSGTGRLARGVGALSSFLRAAAGVSVVAEDEPAEHNPYCSCEREIRDPPREFERIALEPRRRWLAAADSRGRVTLIEARSLVAVRIWKGYREAQCGWTVAAAAGCSDATGGRPEAPLLVLYLPTE